MTNSLSIWLFQRDDCPVPILPAAVLVSRLNSNCSREQLRNVCSSLSLNSPGQLKLDICANIIHDYSVQIETKSNVSCENVQSWIEAYYGTAMAQSVLHPLTTNDLRTYYLPFSARTFSLSHLIANISQYTISELREYISQSGLKIAYSHSARKEEVSEALCEALALQCQQLAMLSTDELSRKFSSVLPHCSLNDLTNSEAADLFAWKLNPGKFFISMSTDRQYLSSENHHKAQLQREAKLNNLLACSLTSQLQKSWPKKIPDIIKYHCVSNYYKHTQWKVPDTCACCGRAQMGETLTKFSTANGSVSFNIELLICTNEFILEHDPQAFQFGDPVIDGHMLCHDGIDVKGSCNSTLSICTDCLTSIEHDRVPKFSLKNNLYRGMLPAHLQDISWVEEQVCALYISAASIVGLYHSEQPQNPFVMYGNTCAHPLNTVQTAQVLPRTVADVAGHIGVLFVGPKQYKLGVLQKAFRVRRSKLRDFLFWLKAHNLYYQPVDIDISRFDEFPEDDALPGLADRIVVDAQGNAEEMFERETAAFEPHPFQEAVKQQNTESIVFMDKFGVADGSHDRLKGRTFSAAAIRNLVPKAPGVPDLTLHWGSEALDEYRNPALLPGLYPTLFPLGLGTLEDPQRPVKIAFDTHANYLLDLKDRCFANHRAFIFVIVNILQRRAAHLWTSATVRRSHFQKHASDFMQLKSDQLLRIANAVERGQRKADLPPSDHSAFDLMHHLNAVSAKIPGTPLFKLSLRNKIKAAMCHFGCGHIYLTLNPPAAHSPLFQVAYGDRTVDTAARYPSLPSSSMRALRLAEDPGAAEQFFHDTFMLMFEHMFGWDFDRKCSKPEGGLFGKIKSWYGSVESTGCCNLHVHCIITLEGGLNASALHKKLEDPQYAHRFFQLFEDTIHHHLPDVPDIAEDGYDARTERPPPPPTLPTDIQQLVNAHGILHVSGLPQFDNFLSEMDNWSQIFNREVKLIGQQLQHHTHRAVCYDYGHTDCRFQFPHERIETSYFDTESKSVVLRCLDPNINYFNPYILVYGRHNHDVKCILSGKAAQAAMYYITNYITKMDLNTHQILNMMSKAVMTLDKYQPKDQPPTVRQLMHRCLAQFTRNQQLSGQRAVRYIRGRDDSYMSHDSVPMMSAMLMASVSHLVLDTALEHQLNYNLEEMNVRLQTDRNGTLQFSDQVEDYLYRAADLETINFYDYVCQFHVASKKTVSTNAYKTYSLQCGHRLVDTHITISRNRSGLNHQVEFYPMPIGTVFPRRSRTQQYMLFTLAHFKPFNLNSPLLSPGQTIEEAFDSFCFSAKAMQVLENWEALYECEDERDAERLRKQEQKSSTLPRTDHDDSNVMDESHYAEVNLAGVDPQFADLWLQLDSAGWFDRMDDMMTGDHMNTCIQPSDNLKRLEKIWREEIKVQGKAISDGHQTADDKQSNIMNVAPQSSLDTAEVKTVQPQTTELRQMVYQALTSELSNKIADAAGLNVTQRQTYNVIVSWLLDHFKSDLNHNLPRLHETNEALRMIFHGPGGTGKTYCLKAIGTLLDTIGHSKGIVFLAPTGSTAALIDGQTLHSAARIKIVKRITDANGDKTWGAIEVDWNPDDRKHIDEVFGDCLMLVIDEFSLLAEDKLAQVDAACRSAKQNWDDWFGGMSAVLCGDMCQYPPVQGSPLYSPISNPGVRNVKSASLNWMGRLAYKSFTHVFEFTEQKRMEGDPEYAAAVLRLRTRECILDDVELFNSRVLRSDTHPDGVDLSEPKYTHATVLVTTNQVRQEINAAKAKALGGHLPSYIECAAVDVLSKNVSQSVELTASHKQTLLHHDFGRDALPGILAFYEGMPVFLRMKNHSVPLKATNGAKGTVVQVVASEPDANGMRHVKLILVKLDNSQANLSKLGPSVFPIFPHSCTIKINLKDTDGRPVPVSATRYQVAVEAAFASTGQGAQGKTMTSVIGTISKDGFYNYVLASRPRCRQDLALTEDVSLQDLNRPLPVNLQFELERLRVLAHNTQVSLGQSISTLSVPEHEREQNLPAEQAKYSQLNVSPETVGIKRKQPDCQTSSDEPVAKKIRSVTNSKKSTRVKKTHLHSQGEVRLKSKMESHLRSTIQRLPASPFTGSRWDSVNWSCAYDSVLLASVACFWEGSPEWCTMFSQTGACAAQIATDISNMLQLSQLHNANTVETIRNRFRDYLYSLYPNQFPRWGPEVVAVRDVFTQTISSDGVLDVYKTFQQIQCENCGVILNQREHYVSSTILLSQHPQPGTISSWINNALNSWRESGQQHCERPVQIVSAFTQAHPILMFEDPGGSVDISPNLEIQIPIHNVTTQFNLQAIIYFGSAHFSCRLIHSNTLWKYDGMHNQGQPEAEMQTNDIAISDLRYLDQKRSSLFIYRMVLPQ